MTENDKIQKKKEREDKKRKKQAEEATQQFMASVYKFVKVKYGGIVPDELECSLKLVESYYNIFQQINLEVQDLQNLTAESRYGVVPHPLLAVLNQVTIRLEKALDNSGLTMKAQKKMEVADIKEEESPLDQWIKDQGKKEVR